MSNFRPCALIPVYNHPGFLPTLVQTLRAQNLPVILVDDGSEESCASVIAGLAEQEGVEMLRHPENSGKGAAIMSGLEKAREQGFSHALQVDADGQHHLPDIPKLLAAARAHPDAIVSGQPIFDKRVPKSRLYSRYITHVWVWINTLSLHIRDSMCGFRVYPVAACCALIASHDMGPRMSFDTEILVRHFWRGGAVISIPTPVAYLENGISHFRLLEDNLRLSGMHARLFFGMLLRFPLLLWQNRQDRA
jgi:glycosyltransferase involved in cell wall biosynthesis